MTDIRKAVEGINGVEIINDVLTIRSAIQNNNCLTGYAIRLSHIEGIRVEECCGVHIWIKSTLKNKVDHIYKNGTDCPWRIGSCMLTTLN